MMPKGVEHKTDPDYFDARIAVRIPMMPKGVEHPPFGPPETRATNVRIPMMPKGVEHFGELGRCAHFTWCEFR